MTRKMKDSGIAWIGEIPEEWEIHPNKRIMSKQKNICAKYCGQKVLSLTMNGVIIRDIENPSGKMPLTFDGYQYVNKGNLLMCLFDIDVTPRCIGIINNDGVTSPAYSQFKLRDIAHGKYYYYYYLNLDYTKELLHLAKNLRHSLTESQLGEIYVPLPKLKEQIRIAGYLDNKCSKIDETIQKEKQVIEKLKQYKQSVITEAVTKGLDSDVKMKYSGVEWIGEIPEHWSISRFSFETWVRARLGWKGLKADEYVQDGYIFLATPNIKNKDIDFVNVNYIDEFRYEESPEIKLSIGDVLLTKDGSTLGTVNVVRYLPKGATVNSSIAVITPGSNLDGIFLMYQIKGDYIKKIIENKKDGMGVPHLFQKDINKIYITLPPIEEQKQIATYLDKKCASIDKAISNKEKLIEKLTEYKKSLIYECVTGKREV